MEFTLNGQTVVAQDGDTVWEAAHRAGVSIPHLCHQTGLRPEGHCRACVVEVAGERALSASCCRAVQPGLTVHSDSPRALAAQKGVLEWLLAEAPATPLPGLPHELADWGAARQADPARWGPPVMPGAKAPVDASHPAMALDAAACIHCTRCVRACREVQGHAVIGLSGRGADTRIVFDQDDPMGESRCVGCGECVQACPTGALRVAQPEVPDRTVDSLCPYCGVGCQLQYQIKNDRIVAVRGLEGPANAGRLCVKGRFGFDYVHHPERLLKPLIRRPGVPRTVRPRADMQAPDWGGVFREATWDEALALAGGSLRRLRDEVGPQALAGFGSAKCSNEEAYAFQKWVRTGWGTHNVDHCTRLCHAASVSALLEGVGSGAVSNPIRDVALADVVIVIGANPAANHPVAASFIHNAVRRGTRLVMADPRRTPLCAHAWKHLAFKPDTDVSLLNALMHVIVEEGLTDPAFIADRTTDFEALRAHLQDWRPEDVAEVCGVSAQDLREVARAYARAPRAMIFWGMGVSQNVHGTDNARCLIALALMTGQVGRPGTGLHPLRGQNNVQGASDAGLIPMMFPDYQRVSDDAARARFEALWGVPLSPSPGLTVVEVMHAAKAGRVKGLYVMGENPAMSDPDLNTTRAGLAALDCLVVQDIFMTETAMLADVVLPASAFPEKTGSFTNTDRTVQLARQALPLPGEARPDLWIIQAMAQAMGLDWTFEPVEAVYEEMRQCMPSLAGLSWARLQREGAVTHPVHDEDSPGQAVVFVDDFPTPNGRARFVPTAWRAPAEPTDAEFPLVWITGRQLEHWHTGSMTRRSAVLDALEPEAVVNVHPAQLGALGVQAGQRVRVRSRRGELTARALADEGVPMGAVFMAFCYAEAAANTLTLPELDPVAKIPGFKACAVQVQGL